MGRSYSLDLRSRVVAFVEAGHSRRAAARHFGVSESFAITLLRRVARSGSPMPARQGRAPGYGRLALYARFLVAAVEKEPDITMPELGAVLLQVHGVMADPAVLSRFLCRRGFTYKKSPDGGGARSVRHPRRPRHLDRATPAEDAR
ncbi:IS630 transposase-related protein [Lichenihabitans sp. Uapishka_5]|uniref:IS630 transposase-related protein n=1 Tax=Lichenihabitans sp. Uapishka_5 TaxID=3037302 RepID=UPI0029E7D5DF|nr:IS630 transposase-related protein [Lichenihabitans sp. Uapishka_5]MDX7954065.1 IS630 transposase-related protein [Lichenihabitans sp. Uapishka_5]